MEKRLIQLMKKKIYPDECETLFEVADFTDEIVAEHFEVKDGKWWVDEDGWLVGENKKCSAAMCVTKAWYTGDVLVEFDAATVAPATRDINITFHGSWNEESNTREMGYVFGLNGFWEGRIGFEKSPRYDTVILTQLFNFVPGEVYHITVGSTTIAPGVIKVFLAVNDVICLEFKDSHPLDTSKYGFVGFEAFCTRVKHKNLKIKRLTVVEDPKTYTPEF
jgi:hypothetical protein